MATYPSKRQMGWLRHVLTVLSVIIFVSFFVIVSEIDFGIDRFIIDAAICICWYTLGFMKRVYSVYTYYPSISLYTISWSLFRKPAVAKSVDNIGVFFILFNIMCVFSVSRSFSFIILARKRPISVIILYYWRQLK